MRSYLLNRSFCWIGAAAIVFLFAPSSPAQDLQGTTPSAKSPTTAEDASSANQTAELHAKFKKLLTGAKMRGQFTVDGQPLNKVQEEAYDIEKVDKLPDGDLWALTTKIKYGDHDLTVPIAIEVKWAGSTPVITLDELTIPGLGTFSARVLLHKDKYAGTWQHGKVGGHLFGTIELAN
ncbi:MAG: hypothetical protein ABI557_05010 [Aureliella sp.]